MMRRFLSSVLFITSVVLLAISSYSLMGMFREYKQADEIKNKLQQICSGTRSGCWPCGAP